MIGLLAALVITTLGILLIFGGVHGDISEMVQMFAFLIPLQAVLWWWFLRMKPNHQDTHITWLLIVISIGMLIIFFRTTF